MNKEGTIQFDPRENANAFKKFYPELATNLIKKQSFAPIRFCGSTSKDYYVVIYNNEIIQFYLPIASKDAKIILCWIDTSKTEGMDQAPAKFLKEDEDVLAKFINLAANLSVFPNTVKLLR